MTRKWSIYCVIWSLFPIVIQSASAAVVVDMPEYTYLQYEWNNSTPLSTTGQYIATVAVEPFYKANRILFGFNYDNSLGAPTVSADAELTLGVRVNGVTVDHIIFTPDPVFTPNQWIQVAASFDQIVKPNGLWNVGLFVEDGVCATCGSVSTGWGRIKLVDDKDYEPHSVQAPPIIALYLLGLVAFSYRRRLNNAA